MVHCSLRHKQLNKIQLCWLTSVMCEPFLARMQQRNSDIQNYPLSAFVLCSSFSWNHGWLKAARAVNLCVGSRTKNRRMRSLTLSEEHTNKLTDALRRDLPFQTFSWTFSMRLVPASSKSSHPPLRYAIPHRIFKVVITVFNILKKIEVFFSMEGSESCQ